MFFMSVIFNLYYTLESLKLQLQNEQKRRQIAEDKLQRTSKASREFFFDF